MIGNWIFLAVSLYCVFVGMIMQTQNFKSTVVFKVVPVVLGFLGMMYSVKGLGWI